MNKRTKSGETTCFISNLSNLSELTDFAIQFVACNIAVNINDLIQLVDYQCASESIAREHISLENIMVGTRKSIGIKELFGCP